MVNDDERCFLALSILEGDRDSHHILADLLEEEGDAGLAEWARARKGSQRKKFDIAIGVLPARLNVRLACAFAIHLHAQHWRTGDHQSFVNRLSPVIEWATVDSVPDESSSRVALHELMSYVTLQATSHFDKAMEAIEAAIRSGLECESETQPSRIRFCRIETGNQTRLVAKHAREELCHDPELNRGSSFWGRDHWYHKYSSQPAREELNWQFNLLKQTLSIQAGEAES